MTILGLGLVGVMEAFSLSMRSSTAAFRLSEASAIAQRELYLAVCLPSNMLVARKGSSGHYTWTLSFSDRPHGLKQATIVVGWFEKGQEQSFPLSQIFSPRQNEL